MSFRDENDLSAPTLLWLHTLPAKVVAGGFVAATLASLPNYGADNSSLPGLVMAVVIVAGGIATLMATRTDPMPGRTAALAAATVPVGALITGLALPGHVANPNQTNALGAGVALCAFLCVRGRVKMAWVAQVAAAAIMTAWGQWTGQGPWTGFLVGLPNLAVLAMATAFAGIMRPAARDVREVRASEAAAHADIVASLERDAERQRQQDTLQEHAWPSLERLASDVPLTDEEAENIVLLGEQLRDSIRSPFFDVPELRVAARAARARGVDVDLFDDHGLDGHPDRAAAFRALAAQWLSHAVDGEITVRVPPPGRSGLASIVAVDADGEGRILRMSADGSVSIT
ncbi:hypothetical protein Mycsm_06999 (plasmid) [Mycobacterium sp. JS623]|uniref:hypothetical protein n=1 Tax=Mycobacterium sp. JS623 TaxID=212767 RepID=UPI0002A5B925|nr:hypothetical protein [Mycobacterium sp. JS623]AGB27100.1 hypothetical protein Mycsm_06999 [Mycobacterium sp. JS623]